MIKNYLVDTRTHPFQANGEFEDGYYFHVRFRNLTLFIGIYEVPVYGIQNMGAKALYTESKALSSESFSDVDAITHVSYCYKRFKMFGKGEEE
jgi:hypothetical protein|tara:strand:- start:185 stop:463 length:279 start_codon:yes stop_codon:yes gene_type:complete